MTVPVLLYNILQFVELTLEMENSECKMNVFSSKMI